MKVQGEALDAATLSENEVILTHRDSKFNKNKKWHDKSNFYCEFCKIKGHKLNRCYKKKAHDKKVKAAAVTVNGNSLQGVQNESQQQTSSELSNKIAKAHYAFVCNVSNTLDALNTAPNALLVDSGATSHIICNSDKFIHFDKSYDPTNHYVELADGTRTNGLIKGKGTASFKMYDNQGNIATISVNDALFIPSYDTNIFSVKKASLKGASCLFSADGGELITSTGTKLPIISRNNIYWFDTICTDPKEILTSITDYEDQVTEDSVRVPRIIVKAFVRN